MVCPQLAHGLGEVFVNPLGFRGLVGHPAGFQISHGVAFRAMRATELAVALISYRVPRPLHYDVGRELHVLSPCGHGVRPSH
jgi:hypothetical protein